MTRLPPHDLDAERALIGVALLDTARALATELPADAFYPPSHQHIWHAIGRIDGQADPVTVAAALAADGFTGGPYSIETLAGLMLDTPTISNAHRYAAIVAEHHQRRQVIHAAAEVTEHAYTGPYDTLLAAVEGMRHGTELTLADTLVTVDWPALWADDTDPEDWLIYPLIPRGRSVALYAPAKAGKSTIALAVIAAAVSGRSVLGMGTSRPPRVLYLDYEMTQADLTDRLAGLGYGPQDDLSGLHYALLPLLAPLDTPAGARAIVKHATTLGVDLVVVDTFGRAVQGDENEADTVRAFYRCTGLALKAAGIAVLRTDHAGKDTAKGQRGSSAKNDDVDVVWQLSRSDSGVVLKRTHSRVTWVPEVLTIDQHHRPDGTITYTERRGDAYPAGTREAVLVLQQAGIPPTMSARKAAAMLRDAGHRVGNDVLRAAQRARKNDLRIMGMDTETAISQSHNRAAIASGAPLDDDPLEQSGALPGALRRGSDDPHETHTDTEDDLRRGAAARSGAPLPHQTGAPPLYIERRARRDDPEPPQEDEMEYPF